MFENPRQLLLPGIFSFIHIPDNRDKHFVKSSQIGMFIVYNFVYFCKL